MKLKMIFSTILMMLSFNPLAHAGAEGGGGGVGFQCGNRVYLADTYKLSLRWEPRPTYTRNEVLNLKYASDILLILRKNRFISEPELMHLLDIIFNKLTFDPNCKPWITNDDGISDNLKLFCKKVQIASQANGHVCYDKTLVGQMSKNEIGLLVIHEAFVYSEKKPGESTRRIRGLVRSFSNELLWNDEFR